MSRIRSVHPGLFTDEAFVSCPPLARLLLIGIWTECDDHGVFEWKPVTFKMKLLPVDQADVPDLMNDLVAFDIIKKVAVDGKPYGLVRNFCRYQRPKWPSYRMPLPEDSYSYVGLNADGSLPNPKSAPNTTGALPQPSPSTPDIPPQRERSRSRRGEKKEPSSSHIDKPVVVVVPPVPEAPAGTTTTTQVENELALQEEPAAKPVSPLGTALAEDWIPDESCMKVAFDSGMSGVEVETEVQRFHALNAQRGTFSQNWNKTWTLWCAEFKRRKDKEAATKAPPRVEVSKGSPFVPTDKQWDGAAKLYAQNGRWHIDYGPEPTSPACRCPPDILEKYIVNHAAVPVLAARAAQVPA